MQDLQLSLLSSVNSAPKVSSPIKEISPLQTPINILQPLENALKEILPLNPDENEVIKMRRILGEKAKDLTDEQIQCTATEFQFLINTWLDEFETDVFNGMTLKEVLNEK